jgi:DNA processing protein
VVDAENRTEPGGESAVARLRRLGEPPAASHPYYVARTSVPGWGVHTTAKAIVACGGAEAAWRAPRSTLAGAIGPARAAALEAARATTDPGAEWQAVRRGGIGVLVYGSEDYPPLLAETAGPPMVLFVRGETCHLAGPAVAIVGTRRMTRHGARMTRALAADLARVGVVVVSGLARGVDTAAHQAALDAGGATVAVLGCGVDVAFPPSNAGLARQIAASGTVVSEYAPGTPAYRGNFPARNRIIAGLSSATVVVEAGHPSGALITAAVAVDEGRAVCAVPGPAGGAATAGTHQLLRSGASAVATAAEVLADADLTEEVAERAAQRLSPTAPGAGNDALRGGAIGDGRDESIRAVLRRLRDGPASVDELAEALRKAPADVNRCLTLLELEGLARASGAGEWQVA